MTQRSKTQPSRIKSYQAFVLSIERAKGQEKEWPLINQALATLKRELDASPKIVEVPEAWFVAVNEFLNDYIKGDFVLPELARLDVEAIFATVPKDDLR